MVPFSWVLSRFCKLAGRCGHRPLLNVFYNALQHVHVQFLEQKQQDSINTYPQYNSYYGGQVGVDINTYQVLIRVTAMAINTVTTVIFSKRPTSYPTLVRRCK